jgi:iron-sulfur cluster repair protein YtfE (RIC family)
VLRPSLARIRAVADSLDAAPPADAVAQVRAVHRFLVEELEPHEEAEDTTLYPALARVLGGHDPTATMSRAHIEIAHLIRRLGTVLDGIDPGGPDADEITELRSLLYGLYAVLQLHFAQEDEGYLSLVDDAAGHRASHVVAR